jgi:hypothetical protein
MEKRLEIIQKLINKKSKGEYGPYNYLIHAILYTIDINQLVNLFINTDDLLLKESLDYHLTKRFKDKSVDLKHTFNKLLNRIKGKLPFKKYQRIRILLNKIVTYLPKSYIRKFFIYFSSSKYSSDISVALNVSSYVWDNSFNSIFLEAYIEKGEEKYLNAVLQNGKSESIANFISEIWKIDYLENYVKNQIIRKLVPDHFEKLGFLKESEPDKYLYALSMASKNPSDQEVELLFSKLKEDQQVFGIWCIGKLGKWDLLEKKIQKYIKD